MSPCTHEVVRLPCLAEKTRKPYPPQPWAQDAIKTISSYHWALTSGPKEDSADKRGTRYHAKQKINTRGQTPWTYEEMDISLEASQMLLVRILVGKIENKSRMTAVFRGVPLTQGDEGWNCVTWVRGALGALEADKGAMGTSQLEWAVVRDAAMEYCRKKRDEGRFDGSGPVAGSKAATYDLLECRETIA